MSRRSARSSAYQLIFGYLFSKEIDVKTYETMINAEDIQECDAKYISDVVYGVKERYDELMATIAEHRQKILKSKEFTNPTLQRYC